MWVTLVLDVYKRQTQEKDLLVLELPPVKPDVLVPVLEIFLKDREG